MIEWILIFGIYTWGAGSSTALTSAGGFQSYQACLEAGAQAAKVLVPQDPSGRTANFVCVPTKVPSR
jgi:hypothetical protein